MPATMHYGAKLTDDNGTSQEVLPLAEYIKEVVTNYFKSMAEEGMAPQNVYELIMSEVELPLIEAVMEYTGNNQSKAATMLGLNRGTFRKKLAHYGML
ncbi:Fis family transcriptional regulator [Thiotrichales bacterium 19S11-10]|nr:Fis family transcriptional regulator [Thiotrichales bacterium 19S11-10]MCF6808093.1 Fis family transcriptional regulator [Thiotrichales bacterium 19S9-11]MCF6812108.1 Fis family transcriptional regulator [Thiotrichales bacterium 19S9-12]